MGINEILKNIDEQKEWDYEDKVCVLCGGEDEYCELCVLESDENFDPDEML